MTASLVAGGPLGDAIADGRAPVPYRGRTGLLTAEIAAAGLTGRGGAGFPVARKLAAVIAAGARGNRPVVVANGAEGEPGSAKDAFLLAEAPHLVLDGLQLAAEAVGSDRAHLYVPAARAAGFHRALAVRPDDRVQVEMSVAADHFLSGEESAVAAALDGREPLPRDKGRRVVDAGIAGRPTLVQNVETLAHLALIARHGAAWFRRLGTTDEPGTILVTVPGTGVLEVAHGTPLVDVLGRCDRPVLVGGFHGAWLAPGEVAVARLSRASLSAWGASPGAGVLMAADGPGLAVSARIAGFLAAASARQCVACVNGLPAMADVLARLAAGERDPRLVERGRRLAVLVVGRGACHHPDGTARLVTSALRVFEEEWR